MRDFRIYEREVAFHLLEACSDFDRAFAHRHRALISHIQMGCDTCSLKFPGNHPTSCLIKQCGLDATMEGSHPTLEILMRFPDSHDIIPILMELHLEAERIRRATSKTVVALLFQSYVWILYFLHITQLP